MKKVIGKNGKIANAMRTIIQASSYVSGEKKVKMFDLFKCKEEKFWDWFVNNSEKLLRNDDQNSKIIDNLGLCQI